MKKTLTAVVAAVVVAGSVPAFAGGMVPVAPETAPVMTYAPAQPMGTDWTGFGLGVELGYVSNAFSAGTSASGTHGGVLYGVRGTYDYDMGSWILGGLATYDFSNIESGSGNPYGTMKKLARVGMRVGADLGDNFLYVTGGAAWNITTLVGSNETNSGWFAGLGGEHRLAGGWSIGGELMSNKFPSINGSGGTLTGTSISSFLSYKF